MLIIYNQECSNGIGCTLHAHPTPHPSQVPIDTKVVADLPGVLGWCPGCAQVSGDSLPGGLRPPLGTSGVLRTSLSGAASGRWQVAVHAGG